MKNFTKGYVWVNGRNLGRYWNKGPQLKLFCPGVWLKETGNEVIVLEMGPTGMQQMAGELTLKTLEQRLEKFDIDLDGVVENFTHDLFNQNNMR